MRAVSAWGRWRGDGRLTGHVWDLSRDEMPSDGVDVALMLKLVPVIKRQLPAKLQSLALIPARRLVVTGSREGMVKRRGIAGRERRVLESFADQGGWRVAGSFETPDEVGLLLQH
jgi:hypothetical protein